MLALIRDGKAVTRADMARYTGLARSTVSQRLEPLIARSLVREVGTSSPTGGRPGTVLAFNPGAGALLVADLDRTVARLAISDLSGTLVAEQWVPLGDAPGPEAALDRVDQHFVALLMSTSRRLTDVRGIGVAVPGPGVTAQGTLVVSPHLPGWEGFPLRDWLAARYDALTIVDKRANLMALGEHAAYWPQTSHLLFVTVGAEISCGIVAGGQLHRGAHGLAGEIGHLPIADGGGAWCGCGNRDCLEAVASTGALAAQLAVAPERVPALAKAADPAAVAAVHAAGRRIGAALGTCVSLFDPQVVVVGGELAAAPQALFAGLREPPARGSARVVTSRLGERAALIGAAGMLAERVLTPEAVDRSLRAA